MSVSYHADVELMAGLPWLINGTLYDANGNPFDVSNCSFVRALLDPSGNPVLPLDDNVLISKTDPTNGGIQISIPAQYTALDPGRYTDALRVTEGNSSDVFWIGQILVAANPMLV
jgi:hypothetical protein